MCVCVCFPCILFYPENSTFNLPRKKGSSTSTSNFTLCLHLRLFPTAPVKIWATVPFEISPTAHGRIWATAPFEISPTAPCRIWATAPFEFSATAQSEISSTDPSEISATDPSEISASDPSEISAIAHSEFSATPQLKDSARPCCLRTLPLSRPSPQMQPKQPLTTWTPQRNACSRPMASRMEKSTTCHITMSVGDSQIVHNDLSVR